MIVGSMSFTVFLVGPTPIGLLDLVRKSCTIVNTILSQRGMLPSCSPNGQKTSFERMPVKNLLSSGVRLGVSSRGLGSVKTNKKGVNEVQDDFILSTVDIVSDPSAPEAFVNGIMEGVEWVWNNGLIEAQDIEKIETEIKKAPSRALQEAQVRGFENFLSLLK